jgi:hypothetical protein
VDGEKKRGLAVRPKDWAQLLRELAAEAKA